MVHSTTLVHASLPSLISITIMKKDPVPVKNSDQHEWHSCQLAVQDVQTGKGEFQLWAHSATTSTTVAIHVHRVIVKPSEASEPSAGLMKPHGNVWHCSGLAWKSGFLD